MFTTANPRGAMLLRVVAGLFSILLVLNEANAASADHESDDSRAAQAAFDRLMAIARKTRDQGTRAIGALDTCGRPSLGSAEAPLTTIEFGSHGCAFCRRHWLKTMPGLRECYIDIGELHYVFIDVALDTKSERAHTAAEAALCADEQDRYVPFRELIFLNKAAFSTDSLDDYAQAADLDIAEFRTCLGSRRYQERVRAGGRLSRKLRIRGTPTSFLFSVSLAAGTAIAGQDGKELFEYHGCINRHGSEAKAPPSKVIPKLAGKRINGQLNRLVTELLPTDAGLVHQATFGDREGRHPFVVSAYCSRIFFTATRAG